jgi:hypothetical protein
MYTTIEIDFDVFKEITNRRETKDVTPNDVLRNLLGLPTELGAPGTSAGEPWVTKGVTFPEGTEFRAVYKGRRYEAGVENGALVLNGERFPSPSAAAMSITGTSVNGWAFWKCKMAGQQEWRLMDSYRKH